MNSLKEKFSAHQNEWLLLLVLLAGLALRLLLLPIRGINPDEGAHLLDARLLLEGQVPIADFGSRQPVYVAVIALFLKVFGISLWAGRLMPLVSSVGVIGLLYLLGKQWRNATTGLVAAGIYALLPLLLMWATIVKTEPLAIFLGCLSMWFLLRSQEGRTKLLIFSGMCSALAFYVRQPTLYLAMAAVVFMVWQSQKKMLSLLNFVLGYVIVVLIVFAIYQPHMSLPEILFSQLNPLHLIWNRALHLFGALPEQYRIVDAEGFRVLDQSMDYTLSAWYHALAFCVFIVIGALGFVFGRQDKDHRSVLFVAWAGFALLLYLYQTASRGFYTQYFTEALPPLILLAAPVLQNFGKAIKRNRLVFISGAIALFFGIYLVQRVFWHISPGMIGYAVLSLLLTVVLYSLFLQNRTSILQASLWVLLPAAVALVVGLLLKSSGMHDLYRFILVMLALFTSFYALGSFFVKSWSAVHVFLLFGFFMSAFYAGKILGPRYETIWSQHTLREVTSILQEHSESSDEVLSGGSIWTFESGLQPFMNTPHPTEFYKYDMSDFETYFLNKPPQFFILDGYTKRKFARYWEFLQERLEIQYDNIATVQGSNYPVEIYQLVPDEKRPQGFLTAEKVGENPCQGLYGSVNNANNSKSQYLNATGIETLTGLAFHQAGRGTK